MQRVILEEISANIFRYVNRVDDSPRLALSVIGSKHQIKFCLFACVFVCLFPMQKRNDSEQNDLLLEAFVGLTLFSHSVILEG